MSQATRFQKNLISKNLRELSTMLSSTAKHVRQTKFTASSTSDIEFSSKRLRSEFIAYKNVLSEDESSLKCFDKMFKSSKTVSDIEMASQQSESQQPGQ